MEVGKVDADEATAALRRAVARTVPLISSIKKPDAPAVGVWNTAQVAVHLAHAWEVLTNMARSESAAPLQDIQQLAELTQSLVTAEPTPDPRDAAGRIAAAAQTFFQYMESQPHATNTPWLVEGISASLTTFTCHLLNETLVHGYDIAHAEGVTWRIQAPDAAIVMFGFLFEQLGKLDPRAMVIQETAQGVHACFAIHVRHAGSVVLVFDDGALTINPAPAPRVDYHLSADASALFLILWNRTSQWPALLRGQLIGWGRRPLLGFRLRALMRNP